MKLAASLLRQFKARALRTPVVAAVAAEPQASTGAAAGTDRAASGDDDAPVSGVSRWLFPQVVLLDCDARDKIEVLDAAASTLQRFHGVDAGVVARALWRREAAITTALGDGVAVPHARIDGIAEPVTLLIRTRRPIPYEAPDRKPVSLLFVIVVPADGDPADHLRLLANVAALFSQPAFRERIAAAADMRAARRAFEEFASAIDADAAAPAQHPTPAPTPTLSAAASTSAHRPRYRPG